MGLVVLDFWGGGKEREGGAEPLALCWILHSCMVGVRMSVGQQILVVG